MWVLRKWRILRNWRIWQGFIKGLAKKLNETTKEAYWQLAIFTKMANWRKWQESIKGFAKPQMRWQRVKSWQTAIIRKREISQKWRVCQKVIEASDKYSNRMTKSGNLTNGDFTKITNLAITYWFGKNRTIARWRYLTTTTRIHFGFALLFKFVNPAED